MQLVDDNYLSFQFVYVECGPIELEAYKERFVVILDPFYNMVQ